MRILLAIAFSISLLAGCSAPVQLALPTVSDPTPAPWTPPKTNLPPDFIAAVALAQKHGLGDPRGGKYCVADVQVRSVWGFDDRTIHAHGWLLAPNRFLCWDGLVYPPANVGDKADLHKDVADALARRDQADAPFAIRKPSPLLGDPRRQVAVALMLLSGEVKLAEKCYTASPDTLVNEYLGSRFERAVTAHMAGDDELAYGDALSIQKNRPAFLAAIPATNQPQQVGGNNGPLFFLEPVDALVSDSARRLRNGVKKVDLNQISKLSAGERITRLIDALDEVSARQMGQPGGVDLQGDPIVAALMKEGDAAVDPLIDAFEKDTRLTRSVSFGRDFFPGRNLLSVKDAAYAAIRGIVQLDRPASQGYPSATELRAFWKQNKGSSPADRWFAILANDHATVDEWMDAAQRLTDPTNVRRSGFLSAGEPLKPGEVVEMRGEPLRTRTNPSVSDLLAKRVAVLTASIGDQPGQSPFNAHYAMRLSLLLVKWDAKAALPSLQISGRTAMQRMADPRSSDDSLLAPFASTIFRRIEAGDQSAWQDYESVMLKVNPRWLFSSRGMIAKPLWKFPDDPNSKRIAEAFFGPEGPLAKDGSQAFEIQMFDPSLRVPAYREAVLRALDDRREIGYVATDRRGYATAYVGNSGSGFLVDDGDAPKPGQSRPYRASDPIAQSISRLPGAPKFRSYWTDEKKTQALKEIKAYFAAIGPKVEKILVDTRAYAFDRD